MIEYVEGDVTRPVGDRFKVIVHVCNDVGAWGAGVSGAIGSRWPKAEQFYRYWAGSSWTLPSPLINAPFKIGNIQLVSMEPHEPGIIVVNLIGQRGLRSNSNPAPVRYDAIRHGLRLLFEDTRVGTKNTKDATVHMPRIGCGLAGGEWSEIEPIIEQELCDKGVHVIVYDLKKS